MVAGGHELLAISVVDEDVAGLDAGCLQLLDHLEDDLERGMGLRLAVGNDLDADDVARLEEVLPGFDGIGGAGQLFHAADRAWS